ncbi:MAG: amino acid adenylation domain-containing protein, partial [Gemmatimonadetes bacterium]|nr:amino acid adenylation domain-containing protein [Gemmatimonadota bacterium]
MAKGKIEAAFPLTPLQEGMLYHALKEPGSGFYHGQVSFRLESAVRPELLRRAFQRAADRHESLRTFFVWKGRDRPIQVVRGQVEIPWTDLDWRDKTNQEVEESWDRLLAEDAAHPFELSVAPLTRVTLVRCRVDAYRVLWSVHHGVSDGWSGSLIVREVLEDYQALAAGLDPPDRPPPPSYARFVGWLESADLNQEERYWRDELGSLEAPTPLPFSTGQATRRAGRTRTLALPDEVYARLKQRAAAMRVTPATVVAGAWGLLLARYAGAEQVVFGSTVSERPAAISGVDSATGLYLNTVPVRAQVDSGMAPAAFLQRLQAAMSAGRAHGVAGLSRIARWSGLAPGDPLFRTVVVFESFPAEVDLNVDATSDGGLDLSHLSIDGPSDLPLGLVAVPGNGLRLELKHDPGLYDTRAADRLLLQFRHILDGLIRPETRAIGTIDCLPAEHDRIVKSWSRGPDLSGTPVDVVELFERAVDRDPTRIALSAQGHDLSYQDLDQATTALAHELRQRGLGPDHLVAVPASRSAETVIAFLSVLKAGAGYAPLDPDLPPVRRDKLLESFDLVLRTDPRVWRHLDTPVVDVARPQGPPLDRLSPAAGPDAPAYVIFTSGSTGAPKGVVVTRSNLAHSNYARFDAYPSNPDAFLLLSPLWVDSSVAGLYWTLTSGGTLTIPRPRAEQDPRGLWKLIRDAGVTHTLMVPSLYGAVLDEIGEEDAAELSTVIMAGESTPGDLVPRHVASIPGADLVNEYGPSEATVWATVDDLTRDPGGPVTIGRPVPSYHVHVLDEAQRPTGIGIEGEIVIGGPGIARGYLGARELTAKRFLPDPSGGEGRVYRTGDRGRWLDDGRIQFLGRADQQLKIRGFRVELEEIEASIRAHPKVEDVALDAGTGDPGSTPLLTAYLVSQDRDLQGPDIESWLAERLPRYMLPERYVSV